MKKRIHSVSFSVKRMLIPVIVFSLFILSCSKEPVSDQVSKVSKEKILIKMNTFLPEIDVKDKVILLQQLSNNLDNFKKHLKMNFANQTASQARWAMETNINTYYAGVESEEEGGYEFDTIFFSIVNDSLGEWEEPFLNGTSYMEQYAILEGIVLAKNNSDVPLSLIIIEIIDFDEESTDFQATLICEDGSWNGAQNCILPLPLVPFSSNEWYYAFPPGYNNYEGANEKITQKLNSNMMVFTDDYLVEYKAPEFYTSWTTCWDPLWWHAYSNVILYAPALNTYLTNYYNVLVNWQIPYGFNNIYVHNVCVEYWNGWDPINCSPNPPCFDSPPGSGIYCWHGMVGFRIIVTPIGLGE